jgi:hypothetical protein
VKSHNFSFHVTAISYDVNIINRSTTPNRVVGLMDERLIISSNAAIIQF